MGPPLDNNGGKPDSPSGSGGNGTQCTGGSGPTLTPMDPSTLPACGTAVCADSPNAHCVPQDKVPTNIGAQLAKCSDGTSYCVPDAQIKSGGAAPPTCKSLNGADGVCLSVCVPQVKQYESLLPQDSCAGRRALRAVRQPAQQHAVGRVRHRQARATATRAAAAPAAAAATHEHAAADVPVHGPAAPRRLDADLVRRGAHCVQAALVPATMAAQLAPCPSLANTLCAPDVFIQSGGNYIPKTCASLDAAEGRCLNVVIPQVKAQSAQLTQDICAGLREVRAVLLAARRHDDRRVQARRAIPGRRSRRSCSRTAAR